MLQDYSNVIRTSQVHVAEREGHILGVLELLETDEGFLLDSVRSIHRLRVRASDVNCLSSRRLKRGRGFESIYLMTNEKMTENQALYERIGYVLLDRRAVDGYSRVLMRKALT